MQAVHIHEDVGSSGRETDPMGIVIYVRGLSRHLEEEHVGRPGGRTIRIQDSGGVLDRQKRKSSEEEMKNR